jgi:hypothetical protein
MGFNINLSYDRNNKIYISFFTDKNFRFREELLINRYKKIGFTDIFVHRSEELKDTELYNQYQHILDQPRGAGYCLWKPYIILEDLNKINDDDILVYLDAADDLDDNSMFYIKKFMEKRDYYISNWDGHRPQQKEHTKRDCFVLMDCNTEFYHNFPQVEAGFLIFKKTKDNIEFLKEYLEYCKNEQIITDSPNLYGDNFPEFKHHLYDQSVLTNMVLKKNIKLSFLLGNLVRYNVVKPLSEQQ